MDYHDRPSKIVNRRITDKSHLQRQWDLVNATRKIFLLLKQNITLSFPQEMWSCAKSKHNYLKAHLHSEEAVQEIHVIQLSHSIHQSGIHFWGINIWLYSATASRGCCLSRSHLYWCLPALWSPFQVLFRGSRQLAEVVQQSSLGLCVQLVFGQEVHHLLHTSGVA